MKLPENPIGKLLIRRRLEKTMKPDPEYRKRRLAQMSPERRCRYYENVEGV